MADSEPGIGKKILSFFIKENDAAPETQAVPAGPPAAAPNSPTAQVSNIAGTAQVNRKFVEHFVQLLEKANLPGPDYFEYKQALQSMEGLGLAEEKQFQAAWASFRAMSGLKETSVLKTSAEQYLGILEKDRASFLLDVDRAIKERVGALQDEQKKLEEANTAYASQIAALQKKIDESKNRLGQISGEVTEQSSRITANKDSFEVTYNSFTEQIRLDLHKINDYLK